MAPARTHTSVGGHMGSTSSKSRREDLAKRRAKRQARPDRGHRLSRLGFAFTALLSVAALAVWGNVLLTR